MLRNLSTEKPIFFKVSWPSHARNTTPDEQGFPALFLPVPHVFRGYFLPHSALHYVECRAALNLTWFRAHSYKFLTEP